MTENNKPTLAFNPSTGYYEGTLKVEVDAEIFRRMILRAIEEDDSADLTNPQVWADIVARVGQISSWINRPHVKVTPVAISDTPSVPISSAPASSEPKKLKTPKKTHKDLLEERLRETAKSVPPHLWDDFCRTPISDKPRNEKEYADVSRLRSDERQVLKKLHEEWQQGNFQIEPDADEAEHAYLKSQQLELDTTIEAVAEAVNGNKLH